MAVRALVNFLGTTGTKQTMAAASHDTAGPGQAIAGQQLAPLGYS
jgi:hypothetical protein